MRRYMVFTCVGWALAGALVGAESDPGVPLRLRDGRPVVDAVYVNGQGPFRFLVDTGSTVSHLDPALARTLHLASTLRVTVTSATGARPTSGAADAQIRLGPAVADHQVVLFDGMEALHRIGGDLQGVLGQAFLSRFDYELDLDAGRLEFGTRGARPGDRVTPFTTVADRPLVSTSLGALVLDSGVPRLVRFGIAADAPAGDLLTATGMAPVGTVFSALSIDGRPLWRGPALAVRQPGEKGAQGLLPVGPFRRVYVCNSAKYVILEPH